MARSVKSPRDEPRAVSRVAEPGEGRVGLLEAALAGLSAGIAIFDEELRLVHCNPQLTELLELNCTTSLASRPSLEAILRAEAARGALGDDDAEGAVRQRLALAEARLDQVDERMRADGRILELRGVPLEANGYMVTCRDVTEARRSAAMIVHMAQHDALTGLPNRLLFADRLDHALAGVRRGGMVAVHYLDLDAFKPVNDSLGHQGGDELLALVATRMRAMVRESDTVARLGGDEFALVQSAIRGPDDAAALAQRLLGSLAAPHRVMGRDVAVGASVGIALAPLDGCAREPLLRCADLALYRAKRSGGGLCFYSEAAAAASAG